MYRGPSSRRSRADKLGGSSSPSTNDTETTEQTRPGPDLLPEPPVKTKGKSRVPKEPTAKFVHGLDAAGRLALLQQAFTGSPRAEPGLSKEQPMGGKSPSKRSRQKALSLDLATVPGSDSIIDPARLSEHSADNAAVNTARIVPVLPTPVVDLSFHQAQLTSGCQEVSGGDSTAPTPRAVSKAELNASKALATVRRARSLTAAAPRKIPAALRLKISPAERHDTVGATNAFINSRPAFTDRTSKFESAYRRPIPVLDLQADGTPPYAYVPPDPAADEPTPLPQKDSVSDPKPTRIRQLLGSSVTSRLLKTIAGLAIMFAVGLAPLQRLLQTSSVEAIVNARTVTLRAPIDGEIHAESAGGIVGKTLSAGDAIFTIENRRADRTHLDDLQRTLVSLEEERPVLDERLRARHLLYKDLSEQTQLFLTGRIAQLEARAAETRAEIASTEAQRDEAKSAFARATELAKTKTESMAGLMRAERDYIVADEAAEAAKHRLEGIEVELQAAHQGIFIGDSYNDRPHSAQRADELSQEIVELDANLRAQDRRIDHLRAEVSEEAKRQSLISAAVVSAPGNGRIWEVLTSSGEEVHKGQDLVRLLDCTNVAITAVVSETVFNRLRIGSPARFRFRDDNKEWPGEVVGLTGVSASAANLAIQPSALMKESYHVSVAVPALSNSQGCDVGRTGRVVFDQLATASAQSPTATDH